MRKVIWNAALAAMVVLTTGTAWAQRPPEGGRRPGGRDAGTGGAESALNRMMAFDKNGDGKLARDELTDSRLKVLFERADADKDGVVTKDELQTLLTRESANIGRGGPGGPGGGPGRDFGGPGDRPEGGPGGPFGGPPGDGFGPPGAGGPPRPGQILPPFLQDELELSDNQREEVDALQKEVDAKLDKILTSEQRDRLREMRGRRGPGAGGQGGPGGRGADGGRGRDGGPGGPAGFAGPGAGGPPGDGAPPARGRGRDRQGERPQRPQ